MPSFYPFAQVADRLIQVALRQDGHVQITERHQVAGAWPAPQVPPNVFHPPADPAQPVKITLSVDNNSWGLVSLEAPEWEPYRFASTHILGRPKAEFAEQIAPHELDYGGGWQNQNPPSYTRSLKLVVQGPIVKFFDPSEDGARITTLDTSKWYSQHEGNRRACFVLRIHGANQGRVVLENVNTGGNPIFAI